MHRKVKRHRHSHRSYYCSNPLPRWCLDLPGAIRYDCAVFRCGYIHESSHGVMMSLFIKDRRLAAASGRRWWMCRGTSGDEWPGCWLPSWWYPHCININYDLMLWRWLKHANRQIFLCAADDDFDHLQIMIIYDVVISLCLEYTSNTRPIQYPNKYVYML